VSILPPRAVSNDTPSCTSCGPRPIRSSIFRADATPQAPTFLALRRGSFRPCRPRMTTAPRGARCGLTRFFQTFCASLASLVAPFSTWPRSTLRPSLFPRLLLFSFFCLPEVTIAPRGAPAGARAPQSRGTTEGCPYSRAPAVAHSLASARKESAPPRSRGRGDSARPGPQFGPEVAGKEIPNLPPGRPAWPSSAQREGLEHLKRHAPGGKGPGCARVPGVGRWRREPCRPLHPLRMRTSPYEPARYPDYPVEPTRASHDGTVRSLGSAGLEQPGSSG
jgi:hypothetical protein